MPADAILPRLVVQRRTTIHALLVKRATDINLFKGYSGLTANLPHWLHQHGLRLTLDYLHLLAFARGQAEARALLSDWAAALGEPGQLALPSLLKALAPGAFNNPCTLDPLCATDLLRLHALALVDAEALSQGCKSLAEDMPDATPLGQPIDQKQWPLLAPHATLSLAHCRHPGLAWRYAGTVPRPGADPRAAKTYREEQVRGVAALASPKNCDAHHAWYGAAFRRRTRWLETTGAASVTLALRSRLFIGLGERGVWETHVLLHVSTGMPYIPASQVKNLIRRTMATRITRMPKDKRQPLSQLLDDLLGVEHDGLTHKGCLVVHDAWWVPGSADSPLEGDLDNPHHADYFQRSDSHVAALPQDSPQPQPQMGVRGQMQFALSLPGEPELLTRCLRWLEQALQQRGIGGRTHAVGAGRFA